MNFRTEVGPAHAEPATWVTWALLAAVLLLHAVVNSLHISDKFFWLDEALTWEMSQLSFLGSALAANGIHKQPPLFFWLGHIGLAVDDSPAGLRGISFAFMTGTLAFVMLGIRELAVSSRLMLAMLLILNPLAIYVSTEFRPYAIAVFFILVSSVLLYRAILRAGEWGPALAYAISALGLQYSNTLNCWVFGCQALAVAGALLAQTRRDGLRASIAASRPLLSVSAILCTTYALFLFWLNLGVTFGPQPALLAKWTFWSRLVANIEIVFFPRVMATGGLGGWMTWIAISLFIVGLALTRQRRPGLLVYLIALFIGQLVFSTYMTWSRVPWFHERYVASSYVAFALLAALGFEFLVSRRWPLKISLTPALALLMVIFPGAIQTFMEVRAAAPIKNPYREIIAQNRCPDRLNAVFCSPGHTCVIADFAFRHADDIRVTRKLDLAPMRAATDQRACIIYLAKDGAPMDSAEKGSVRFVTEHPGYGRETIYLPNAYPQFLHTNHFPDMLTLFRPGPND